MNFLRWKNPLMLLFGIGVSNLGAWIYLIALNLIVLDMTGSPLAVSVLYILIPVATLFTNFWAGSFVDRLNQKRLMILLDVFRALFIFALPFFESLFLIYIFVFFINVASSIFEPTSMVYMTKLIPKSDRQRFNALRNFINSCGFILGPSIAGALFLIGSPYLAIYTNSIALFISALIIMLLPNLKVIKEGEGQEKFNLKSIINDWKVILSYGKGHKHITVVYLLFGGVTVFMTALDSLEAAFATEVLLLSESTYGFLVSIAGVGIVVGSLINAFLSKYLKINLLIGLGVIFTPVGYLIFSISNEFAIAAIGFFLLTFSLSFANTGFFTFYQNNVPVNIMGRFSSVFGIIEAMMIIMFTITIGLSAELFEIRPVYIIGSAVFLILGLIINIIVQRKSKSNYYNQQMSVEQSNYYS